MGKLRQQTLPGGLPPELDERVTRNGVGQAPAVALVNPKFSRNVAAALRSCSCFGIQQLWWSGDRVRFDGGKKGRRLPREERMKGYGDVELCHGEYFFDAFAADITPVAVEIRPGSENLPDFEHPANALYVFGPEDGTLGGPTLSKCIALSRSPHGTA